MPTLHEISLAYGSTLSPLRFLMEKLKPKLAKGNPRLGMVRRMIWGVIRLIAAKILAPVVGRT